jgi:hypothetical protein
MTFRSPRVTGDTGPRDDLRPRCKEEAEAEDDTGTRWIELDARRNAVFDESRPPEPSYVFVG